MVDSPAPQKQGGSDDDDPWGFLAAGKSSRMRPSSPPPVVGVEPTPAQTFSGRERGELRARITAPSLKRRAWPMALSLMLVSLAGFLTEIVAAAQVISIIGPRSMLYVYPLGGVGLILLALAGFTFIDSRARLPMIRAVALIYAAAFVVALSLLAGSLVPALAAVVLWLLADQLNFLLPLLIWSLAGDEFNVAEGRKIFGWIVTWTYLGQVVGLALAAAGAPILEAMGAPLPWLVVLAPLLCVFVAVWLPKVMKGSAAATGLARSEDLGTSLGSAWGFVSGIKVWRYFLVASTVTFTAGMLVFIGFLTEVELIADGDAATIQFIFGTASLGALLLCWGTQVFFAEKLQDKIGIPGVLLILPIAAVLAGVALLGGVLTGQIGLLVIGFLLWMIPRWSVDENARRAALALVPDERRTRVSFFVDLGPVAVGLVLAGPLAAIGLLTDRFWIVPALAVVLAACAIWPAMKVRAGWEDSLLSWRLRRRKRSRTIDLGDI